MFQKLWYIKRPKMVVFIRIYDQPTDSFYIEETLSTLFKVEIYQHNSVNTRFLSKLCIAMENYA